MIVSYLLAAVLVAVSIPIIICIMKAQVYEDFVGAIDKKRFAGAKYYGIGFAFIDLFRLNFQTVRDNKIREQAGILFGRKYADFYLRVLYAQSFTYSALILYLCLFMGTLMGGNDGLLFGLVGLGGAVAVFWYYMGSFKSKIEDLNYLYMTDFPAAVSTIALLVNGGMFLRDAWKQVAYSSDAPLYMQMRGVTEDMRNGVSETDAFFAFANRCGTKEIRKFSTLITQAIQKGGRDLADSLVKQSDLLMNEKRQLALQQGEKASNKLMFPISMIFIGVLVMIMVPIMANMNM